MALEKAAGPGSFQVHFLDALAGIREEDVECRIRMVQG
jgi:hydroxyethylthiazole kinase-like sugar kinase family protein